MILIMITKFSALLILSCSIISNIMCVLITYSLSLVLTGLIYPNCDSCTWIVLMCTQSCLTLCYPMDYSPPDSSVYGIFQARTLERVAISNSKGSPDPGIKSTFLVSPELASKFFTTVASEKSWFVQIFPFGFIRMTYIM